MSEEKKDLTGILELTEQNEAPISSSKEDVTETFTQTISTNPGTETLELGEPVQETPEFIPPPPQENEDPQSPPMPEDVGPQEPYDLWIDGPMSPEEKAKLIEIVETEKFGVRESDIELQLQGNRIRIPRISEYAGVLLVQALRSSRAVFRLTPTNEPTTLDTSPVPFSSQTETFTYPNEKPIHPAENIPVVASPTLSNSPSYITIDMLTASASFSSNQAQPHVSTEYQTLLEALQRELKYKAYRKKADAVVSFQVQLIPLALPSEYKMVASGTAVKYSSS